MVLNKDQPEDKVSEKNELLQNDTENVPVFESLDNLNDKDNK